jgi:hypothetical protein
METARPGSSGDTIPNSRSIIEYGVPGTLTYLQSSAIAGSSPTTWYLLADPMMLPAFQVAYLEGNRMPIIETREAEFNTLGFSYRCYWDFGVAQMDYRGAIKSSA